MLQFPQVDPVLLSLGPLEIRWYGLAYMVGILGGFKLFTRPFKEKLGFNKDDVMNLMTATVVGIILGGRLGYVLFYQFAYYFHNPLRIFSVWEGGMSYHGGAIGALIAFLLFTVKKKKNPLIALDFLGVGSTLGLFLGRLSNFVNGELYGRVTDLPWAMVFPDGGPLPRHPSQLYEAFFEGIVLFSILWWLFKSDRLKPGQLFGVYLLGYGCFRFLIEYFREPDAHLGFVFMQFSMGQILCFVMILAGAALIVTPTRR